MRHTVALAQLLLLGAASALPELSIQKKSHAALGDALPARLRKRAGTDTTNIFSILTWSLGGAYYANVTVGTPPQDQVVILDTGSSDLYFDASSAPACQSTNSPYSCRGGTFDPSSSKTYKVVDQSPAFNTSFGDGSTAVGPFAVDTIGIGAVTIENVQFGVAEEVNSTTGYALGLMGVGYSENEATSVQYPNMPEVLKDAGVINSRLYSVYLNDVGQSSGSILFGGIDKSKFTGSLVTLDILPDAITEAVDQFVTTVTDLSVDVGGKSSPIFSGGTDSATAYGNSNKALAVLLDTGSTAWSVPADYYTPIAKAFSYVDSNGFLPCSHRDSGDSVTLTFGAKLKVTVPSQEFIIPVYNASTGEPVPYDTAGNPACAFMISSGQSTGEGFMTLGDAILRSMYVVFDLDNGQVSLAQAAVNTTSSPNVVSVAAGPSGVASAVSGVSAAPSQTWSIAAGVSVTESFVASSAATAVGTATGAAAVPTQAQPQGSGATAASANPSSSATKGAAHTVFAPKLQWGGVASLVWGVCMAVVGATLVM